MIRGSWDQQDYAIVDVKLGDADTYSYKYEVMVSLLAWRETINKDKHGKHFHDQ